MLSKPFFVVEFFDKTAFCLGEKEGMLVNDECSSRYNRAGDFFVISLGQEQTVIVY